MWLDSFKMWEILFGGIGWIFRLSPRQLSLVCVEEESFIGRKIRGTPNFLEWYMSTLKYKMYLMYTVMLFGDLFATANGGSFAFDPIHELILFLKTYPC